MLPCNRYAPRYNPVSLSGGLPVSQSEHGFASPFSWRYGSPAMRKQWSEEEKHRLWRRLWVELASAQESAGLVSTAQREDLERSAESVDLARIEAIESVTRHDLVAAIRAFSEQTPIGAPILHLGATSADIEDNADALRIRASLRLVYDRLNELIVTVANRVNEWSDVPVMGFTHLQPAEPTTAGYRLSLYLQDLVADAHSIHELIGNVRGKGLKGAVGTAASYTALLEGTGVSATELEERFMRALDLPSFAVTGQTYPRKQDWRVVSTLSGLAATLAKIAFDIRLLQSPLSGEWNEPFASKQTGSSAMPFKRNPIACEKVNSLARLVASLVDVAWQNAAQSFLERTLDDSANRRELLPVAFLATDESLIVISDILRDLRFDERASRRTFERYAPFAATEPILMQSVRAGGDRQNLHEHLRELSMHAWSVLQEGGSNPLPELLRSSEILREFLSQDEIDRLLDPTSYLGDAPVRARALARRVLEQIHPEPTEED